VSTSPSVAPACGVDLANAAEELHGFDLSQLQEVGSQHVPGAFKIKDRFFVIRGSLTSFDQLSAYKRSKEEQKAAAVPTTASTSKPSTSLEPFATQPGHALNSKHTQATVQDPRLSLMKHRGNSDTHKASEPKPPSLDKVRNTARA